MTGCQIICLEWWKEFSSLCPFYWASLLFSCCCLIEALLNSVILSALNIATTETPAGRHRVNAFVWPVSMRLKYVVMLLTMLVLLLRVIDWRCWLWESPLLFDGLPRTVLDERLVNYSSMVGMYNKWWCPVAMPWFIQGMHINAPGLSATDGWCLSYVVKIYVSLISHEFGQWKELIFEMDWAVRIFTIDCMNNDEKSWKIVFCKMPCWRLYSCKASLLQLKNWDGF